MYLLFAAALAIAIAATQLQLSAAQREVPAPRNGNPDWRRCWSRQLRELKAAKKRGKGYQLLLYGDSLAEAWRGTDHCKPCDETIRTTCKGAPEVLQAYFGRRWRVGVAGIAGDQAANLIWRLQNGQLPTSSFQPRVAILFIGTNDLGAAAWGKSVRRAARALKSAVPGVAERVQQAAQLIRSEMPSTQVVVMALLPRSTNSGTGIPVQQNSHSWPSIYTNALQQVNARLRDYTRLDGKLHFLDCGERFLTPDRRAIDARLMPDALHPGPAGHRVLAKCMRGLVSKLMC